ncbi:hypothetical protein KIF53_03070 [Chromobacterium subtsugae]|uniref:Uncharacterized protein n=1 Tax=Chromobacterium subtsugae TaxID=251747 RepID=A0ABS7F9F3_9NEIS|nr:MULTISPECIES: hypothetical protein [Chromobacterium]MBW7564861.1 hypothetical protein [Chromobacterium subtsugae]MBW8286612.1 hypothetical protein [Chromobacterium subtsugae]WSE91347.1 hypothetical protein U6115_21130 [Chromobacterium subtsugae]WVH59722.1 hypothetical protein U6151_21160 [Chromobacterium subtsugae]
MQKGAARRLFLLPAVGIPAFDGFGMALAMTAALDAVIMRQKVNFSRRRRSILQGARAAACAKARLSRHAMAPKAAAKAAFGAGKAVLGQACCQNTSFATMTVLIFFTAPALVHKRFFH